MAQALYFMRTGGRAVEDWRPLPRGSFFRSARLDCALSLLPDAMVREEEHGKLLALPYSENTPFPLPELFCLARIGTAGGRRCVIYRVDEKNSPIL